uniref:Secreted protein n=1 Tax=Astyanax mexicanus TaxID=7994 RepID=A0A3B1KI78_ASTMX
MTSSYLCYTLHIFFSFLRQGLTLSPRWECSGMIMAHSSFNLLGFSQCSASSPLELLEPQFWQRTRRIVRK